MIPHDHALAQRVLELIPMNNLGKRLQEQVLNEGELIEYKRRKIVFEAGARDPHTFYLLDGELELQSNEASPQRVVGGEEGARRALAQLQPRRYTGRTLTNVIMFRIERAVLDHILSDEQVMDEGGGEVQVRELEEDEEDGDWMTRLLSSELFTRLPHDNIQRFFAELEPLEASAGQVVVEQGTPGDYLYIVAEGQCAVTRRAPKSGQEIQLAVLKEGDTFGEESLISNSPRNASVKMLTDGFVMLLPKRSFEELVSNPTLTAVTYSEARKRVEEGAIWLDVRFSDEHQTYAIENSINMPLNVLRLEAGKLDTAKRFIVYCDTGARSSTGAFLLARKGLDVCYLAGGLERTPLWVESGLEPKAAEPAGEIDDGFQFEVSGEDRGAAGGSTPVPAGAAQPQPDKAAAAPGRKRKSQKSNGAQPAATAPEPAPPETAAAGAPVQNASGEIVAELRKELSSLTAARDEADAALKTSKAELETAAAERDNANAALETLKAELANAAAERDRAGGALTSLRADAAKVVAERDKASAYGRQAADAARELKRRSEELHRVAQAERAKRESLESELSAARADAERHAALERTRFEGELANSLKKLEQAQLAQQSLANQFEKDRERLEARTKQAEGELEASARARDETEASRIAAERAYEDSLQILRSQLESEQAKAAQAESEREKLRAEVEDALTTTNNALHSKDMMESELQRAVASSEERLRTEKARLEAEQAQLREELENLAISREEAGATLRNERAELDTESSAVRARGEELDRRAAQLEESRVQLDEDLERREQALTTREAALSEDKASWQKTVDAAIEEERERLEASYAKRQEEQAEAARVAAEEAAGQRIAELTAVHDTRMVELRAEQELVTGKLVSKHETELGEVRAQQVAEIAQLRTEHESKLDDLRAEREAEVVELRTQLETSVATLRAEIESMRGSGAGVEAPDQSEAIAALTAQVESQSASIRAEYELKLAEQEALLEDGRRRVEAENLRLREALSETQRAMKDLEARLKSVPATTRAPVAPQPKPAPELKSVPTLTPPQAVSRDEVPAIEAPPTPAPAYAADNKARVISPTQFAEIRRKMQEKMKTSKGQAG